MSKRSFIGNTIACKCPRCQQSDLFVKPFSMSKPVDMPEKCPACGQLFIPEPGFYYGAMFLSYIVSGFLFLGIVGFLIIGFKMSVNAAMGILLLIAAALYFPLLRFSRSLWINIMIKYDPDALLKKGGSAFGSK
ncbi:MAG: DUF983 domain-containing protein [Saprospiraceae bacterium]|jgi:uncharacterized protein (DUF983 family)|nr:DUF983 domain-containing protein [Saprospiraceae bacterium]MBK6566701.1 DUF983 domain-containing protein [Saprospiraceae bacterium]MBK6785014.1 DUF983 domain-containing protein [Saprospiraceae bacterium]MBK7522965.1 DUF983 domain-containing protein [Saprospiraceae bacterium]MBK8081809.1 DUF983 domain-containing protein [Saprospiraceae bacterium]